MEDTPTYIQDKQYEIFFKLSMQERIKQSIEMIDFGFMVLENSIKTANPHASPKELKIEKIKRLYADDFSEIELAKILAHFQIL
jgi:hypothetical protein